VLIAAILFSKRDTGSLVGTPDTGTKPEEAPAAVAGN
jgi:hypothetical protein